MVEHLVLFKLKSDATDEQVDAMLKALNELPGKISEIQELTCGRNFSDRSQGNQLALLVRFHDRKALEIYLPHPAHKACVETYIKPILEQVTVADYEPSAQVHSRQPGEPSR